MEAKNKGMLFNHSWNIRQDLDGVCIASIHLALNCKPEKIKGTEHYLSWSSTIRQRTLTPHYPWRGGVTRGTAPRRWGGTSRYRTQTSSRSAWASCQWGGAAAGWDNLPSTSCGSPDGPAAASVPPWGRVVHQSVSSLHNVTNDNEYEDDDEETSEETKPDIIAMQIMRWLSGVAERMRQVWYFKRISRSHWNVNGSWRSQGLVMWYEEIEMNQLEGVCQQGHVE